MARRELKPNRYDRDYWRLRESLPASAAQRLHRELRSMERYQKRFAKARWRGKLPPPRPCFARPDANGRRGVWARPAKDL